MRKPVDSGLTREEMDAAAEGMLRAAESCSNQDERSPVRIERIRKEHPRVEAAKRYLVRLFRYEDEHNKNEKPGPDTYPMGARVTVLDAFDGMTRMQKDAELKKLDISEYEARQLILSGKIGGFFVLDLNEEVMTDYYHNYMRNHLSQLYKSAPSLQK